MDYKRSIQWIVFGLLIFLKDTKSQPRYQENYIEEDKFLPNFITLGQKYSIAVGSTVVLPCKINETEHSSQYVLAWKRNIAVLTAGSVKVTVNPRIRLMPTHEIQNNDPHTSSYNLEIRDVRLTDAGEYACQIGSMEPKEIVHILEVLVPPKIDVINPSTRVDVSKGASIRLECRANGNPMPKVVWSRKNNVLPNGEPNITSSVLEMMHADRHTVGHYICTADNRVGQADTKEIFVNVLYSPEIEVEQSFVHTGVGFEAQLTCIVHSEPSAQVTWYKDTTKLGITEQHSEQNHGNKHFLIIRNVTYNDFGNYTCQASNGLGKDRALLTLSGIPTVCVFDSPALSNHRDQYNISWTVQSYSPIREYRIYYRKIGSLRNHNHHDKWDNHVGQHHYNSGDGGGTAYTIGNINGGVTGSGGIINGYQSSSQNNNNFGSTSGIGGLDNGKWEHAIITEKNLEYPHNIMRHNQQLTYGYNNNNNNGNNDGGNYRDHLGVINYNTLENDNHGSAGIIGGNGNTVITGGTHRNHNIRHRMSFLLKNLTPASNYEARVQARNDHNWNKMTSSFHFSTRAEDLELEPSAQPAVSKTAGVLDKDVFNGASSTLSSLYNSKTNLIQLTSNSYLNRILSIIIVLCAFLSL